MTSNIIISSGACFVLGLALNRPKRKQPKPTSNPPALPRAAISRTNTPLQNAPTAMGPERYSPQRIMNNIRMLRDSNRIGYVTAVQNLRMMDDYGSHWSIGVQSMNWYISQNGIWVHGMPSTPMRVTSGGGIFLRPPTPTTAATFTKPSTTQTCPHCGAENEVSSRFCIICGRDVLSRAPSTAQPKTHTCGRCGGSVKAGKRFCTKCGAPQPFT